jgi:hypothetical protein
LYVDYATDGKRISTLHLPVEIYSMAQDSYLLRFWHTPNNETWRATLISVDPEGREQHFGTVDDLLVYLQWAYSSTQGMADAMSTIGEKSKRLND